MAGEQAKNKLDPAQILDGMLEMDGALAPHYSYFHDYSATNMAYCSVPRKLDRLIR
jgi:hypothetical protein